MANLEDVLHRQVLAGAAVASQGPARRALRVGVHGVRRSQTPCAPTWSTAPTPRSTPACSAAWRRPGIEPGRTRPSRSRRWCCATAIVATARPPAPILELTKLREYRAHVEPGPADCRATTRRRCARHAGARRRQVVAQARAVLPPAHRQAVRAPLGPSRRLRRPGASPSTASAAARPCPSHGHRCPEQRRLPGQSMLGPRNRTPTFTPSVKIARLRTHEGRNSVSGVDGGCPALVFYVVRTSDVVRG